MKYIFLLVFLTIFTWAQDDVPYVDTNEAVAQSATLSPDGETFYTYANNTLTHWSLNSVKVLERIKIKDTDFSNQSLVNIHITSDKKRIIFVHHKKAFGIFDLSTKKFTKKIHEKFYRENLIGSSLVTIDTDKTMKIWNSLDLVEEQRIKIENPVLKCDECSDFPLAIFKTDDKNIFVLVTAIRMLVFDVNKLKVIKELISYNKNFDVSLNRKFIFGEEKSLNLQTLQEVPLTQIEAKESHKLREQFSKYDISKAILLDITKKESNFYDRYSDKKLAIFYIFNDSNWLIITHDGYFDGSPQSRKYLYMKTLSGESVPIDDAT